ncbi:uracil-DNA glycosylase [candidate division KSB1 bacterium]|nr:uracil-DNA glycosylase [candidate division KSB1 bacterium]
MTSFESLITDVQNYLHYQKEVYGDELYVDASVEAIPVNPQPIQPADLIQLDAVAKSCTKCSLHSRRQHVVFGKGNPNADVMIIGEGPGVDEDKQGEPFVGAAGQLLTKILAAIELKRDEVYITNIVKCHPPNNRDPLPEEQAACRPFLEQQIKLIRPKFILALGRVAGQVLSERMQPLNSLRGKTYDFLSAKVIVTYHPAALLRHPEWKRDTWEDVQMLQRLYKESIN